MAEKKIKKIVTHGINFHNDDLFASATIMLVLERTQPAETYKFVRLENFDPKGWQDADVVLDIGRVYDERKNRFDHHQEGGAGKRENGIPYATFGLVWKKFGKKLAGSNEVVDYVDRKLVQPIDADDNGISLFDELNFEKIAPITVQDYVYLMCEKAGREHDAGDKKSYDRMFKKLLPFAKTLILEMIEKGKYKVSVEKKAKAIYDKMRDKRVMIVDKFIPADFSEFPEPLVIVYPDRRSKGSWAAKTIRLNDLKGDFRARMYFPKEWAGKDEAELARISGVPDAFFCHNSGFLIVAKSKEGVLKMVERALAML